MTAIWWIRRDLRLHDNQALQAAWQSGGRVVPVFIQDAQLLGPAAPLRKAFLWAGLHALDAGLRRLGSRLILRTGDPLDVLQQVMQETGAGHIYTEEDYSPYALRRDRRVAAALPLSLLPGVTVLHPGSVRKPDGRPYTVFTPFSRAWKAGAVSLITALSPLPAPQHLDSPGELASEAWPAIEDAPGFPSGELEAQRRLESFCAWPLYAYADRRNRLDLDGTSALSPYLRFGMISARQALLSAQAARWATDERGEQISVDTWVNELIWREFYIAILYHFPEVLRAAFQPGMRQINWRDAPWELQAWKDGLTGYPVVDAAMRQLRQTGWMHNRGRMIVASFLVKDLLVNWQEGERWFMRNLVDGHPAANNGGWQWVAGVGTDAAPYFRIFNPVLQGQKFDPAGEYVRRWVPELAQVPAKWIHRPWEMPAQVQRACGVQIGKDYPLPVIDRAAVRERTLSAYQHSRLLAG